MKYTPSILIALLLGLAICHAQDEPAKPEPASLTPTPQSQADRTKPEGEAVILRIGRDRDVSGYVVLEEDDVIVVETLEGELSSYPKSWLLKIVRLIPPLPDQRGVVILKNGQRTEGEILVNDFEQVALLVEGIRVRFGRDTVDEVILQPTFQQQYDEYKASLQPQMHQRHLSLGQWLVRQRRYELAEQELKILLANKPDFHEAKRLLNTVEAQLSMIRGTIKLKDTPEHESEPARRSGPVYDYDLLPKQLISNDDVNVMRVFEVDFDNPPKLNIEPDTIREMLERYGTSKLIPANSEGRTAMFRADPAEILRFLFQLRARDLYPQVQVLTEPHALNIFRERVHNSWLINRCATSRCHGGPSGGRFFLHNDNYKNARVRMTNLLILERLELDPQWPLINYDAPNDSLIVQYGLPRDAARKPHPDIRGWRPVFTRSNRPMLRHTVDWIQSMMKPRPEYPVAYDPPILGEGGTPIPPPPLDTPQSDRSPR